jgi:ABC-type branched-subunit amino acid transport system substrate-binding protein
MALFDSAGDGFALIVRDTGGTPDGATRAAGEALSAGAQLILGPVFAASVTAVTPAAQSAGVPVIAFSTDRSVAGNGIFLIGLLPRQQIERVVGYAGRQGLHRIAALVPNSAYGQTVVVALKDAARQSGMTAAQIEYYPPGATDVSDSVRRLASYEARTAALAAQREALEAQQDQASQEALARLKQYQTLGGPGFDAVLLPEGGAQLRAIAPLLPYYDIDPDQVRLLGTALWDDSEPWRETTLVGGWFAAPQPEPWKAFQDRYQSIYGMAPPRVASLAYDATALAAVLARSGGPNFTIATLTQPNGFAGVDGVFRFLPDGTSERGLAVLEVKPQGSVVIDPAPKTFEKRLF